MTGWTEDNFFERLLVQVRQQHGAEPSPCPNVETLCTVFEADAPAPLAESVMEHLRHCSHCADLQNRLLNFDASPALEPEAEWCETRKRLDNWLEVFLRSKAGNFPAASTANLSSGRSRWGTFWGIPASWKLVWGLGVAALLVLAVDGVLLIELREQPQLEVAGRSTTSPKTI